MKLSDKLIIRFDYYSFSNMFGLLTYIVLTLQFHIILFYLKINNFFYLKINNFFFSLFENKQPVVFPARFACMEWMGLPKRSSTEHVYCFGRAPSIAAFSSNSICLASKVYIKEEISYLLVFRSSHIFVFWILFTLFV